MDCFCGCRRQVPRSLTEANLRLGETALDLLAWDRYVTIESPDPSDRAESERIRSQGAECHRRLLALVHGDGDVEALIDSDEWLVESRSAWTRRPAMAEQGSFLRAARLRLTDADLARLDRIHPERSFSAAAPAPQSVPNNDLVAELARLGELRREGLLTEEEFRSAKAKLLG